MQKVIATLKLLCVPVLVALLHVSLQFWALTGVERVSPQFWVLTGVERVSLQFWALTDVDPVSPRFFTGVDHMSTLEMALHSFVVQTAISLLLTSAIGTPYFRWSLRRQREGYGVWLSGWLLVYALQLLFNLEVLVSVGQWVPLASLLLSIVSVSTLWWWLFYAGESATG